MADFTRNETINEAIRGVMQSVGLVPPASVFGSTDRTAQQMLALANEVGLSLLGEHDWQQLARDYTFTTTAATEYALPADFDKFANDASWNLTTGLPIVGSLTDQEWQATQARYVSGGTLTLLYQVSGDKVVFFQVPADQQISIPYQSRSWVKTASGTYRDNLQANDDTILYDSRMFRAGLKLAWYEAKEFNTARVTRDFVRAMAFAKAKDIPGRTLSLVGGQQSVFLGELNMPETGYGST